MPCCVQKNTGPLMWSISPASYNLPVLSFTKFLEAWEEESDMYVPIKTENSRASYSLHTEHILYSLAD